MRKFDKLYYWYNSIQDEYKEEYFQTMKKDYERIAEDSEFYDYLMEGLSYLTKTICRNVLKSKDHEEFDKNMEIFELKQEIKELKKFNKELLSSSSWKVTKPLRAFKRIFK